MSLLRTTFALIALAFIATGCKEARAIEVENASSERPAAGDSRVSTYYIARLDTRRCAYPRCGGLFVSAVNQSATECYREPASPECYLADIDVSAISDSVIGKDGIRDAIGYDTSKTRAVLLGSMEKGPMGFGTLVVDMAWIAMDELPITGNFHRVWDNGIVCVAAPCPSFDQEYLNRGSVVSFHGLLLDDVPTHATDSRYTAPALQSKYGMIVAGVSVVVENAGPAGEGVYLKASQVFLPAVAARRN